jgi:hypothetical protein
VCAVWISSQPTIFRGFSLYIVNLARKPLDRDMGRGSVQRPVYHVNEPKKTGTRSARARSVAIPYSIYISTRKPQSICTLQHYYLQFRVILI